jgi:hypothetical protein
MSARAKGWQLFQDYKLEIIISFWSILFHDENMVMKNRINGKKKFPNAYPSFISRGRQHILFFMSAIATSQFETINTAIVFPQLFQEILLHNCISANP